MKIVHALVLVSFISGGCLLQAAKAPMTVKAAQDAVAKAETAVLKAKPGTEKRTATANLAKAKKDLAAAQQAAQTTTTSAAVAKEAASVKATMEAAKMAAVTGEQAKTAEVKMALDNTRLALVAASKMLQLSIELANQKAEIYPDAAGKTAPALHLALAYLPVEFFTVSTYYGMGRTDTVINNLGGNNPTVRTITYAGKTALAIAQERKTAEGNDARWDAIIKALAA